MLYSRSADLFGYSAEYEVKSVLDETCDSIDCFCPADRAGTSEKFRII